MVMRMTVEEYEKKYGVLPGAPAPNVLEAAQKDMPDQNFAVGLAKGIGRSGVGLFSGVGQIGRGIQKGLARASDAVLGTGNIDLLGKSMFDADTEEGKKLTDLATPKTTAEKVGKFAGDVAQFAIPSTAVSKATKSANLLTRMVAEGVTSGTTATVQQGGFDKEAMDVAILSAIFPAAGALVKGAKVKIGEKAASRVINSLIKPLKNHMSYGKNPGRAVAREGIISSSLDDLEQKIGNSLTKRVDQLKNVLAESKELFDFSKTLVALEEALDKAAKQNNKGAVNRLNDIRQALTQNLSREIDETTGEVTIKSLGARNLTKLTAEEATSFLREIGELTAFTGNQSDDKLVNSALIQVYGNAKTALNKNIPERQALSEHIADLISAKIATKYRSEIAERANLLGFSPKVLGSIGAIGSAFTGNPIPFIIGLGAAGFEKAMSTPAAKTRLATWLSGAAKEQKKQLFEKAPWAKAAIYRLLIDDVEDTQNIESNPNKK